ncbi:LysR family transcriptional regulator [Roseinatronobacter sp. S2]|uniref:LysR family transcriptional regulator n=1 Tax=Roseinatronobacter sp. S2 TaxID=3035471 RepID=UPI00240F4093|nr:LysR family transcriptional regulator [Roseinatronobacter sp. S2]WFE76605.1 LysR family transcriptional regulator [Roseinatronobacter sp. S2]
MKFRQLEAFNHVMNSGSMVAAAAMMHISQPAVSRLISDLETDLKFSLFNRKQGTLTPTQNGLAFYEAVEESFMGIQRLENTARHIRGEGGQVLRVAVTHSLAATLLPPVLKAFKARFPDVNIVVHSHRLSQIILRLQNASVDIAIGSQIPKMPGSKRELIGHVRQVCVMPSAHPLAEKEVIFPEDLSGETILRIRPDGPASWSEVFQILEDRKVPFVDSFEIDTSLTAYSLIAQGLAIGVIEPFSARFWPPGHITLRPFEPSVCATYYFATHNRRGLEIERDKFIGILRGMVKKLPEFLSDKT